MVATLAGVTGVAGVVGVAAEAPATAGEGGGACDLATAAVWARPCHSFICETATLIINNSSDLVLSDSHGHSIWRTETNITAGAARAHAVLLDQGNFVLRLPNGKDIWQSFDYPTDTILPAMKFLLSYKAKIVGRLVAWKGLDDPSSGDFSYSGDPSSPYLQVLIWNKTIPYCRLGVWNGVPLAGKILTNTSSIFYQTLINTGDEFYAVYTISNNLPFTRVMLDYAGNVKILSWNSHSSSWALAGKRPSAACDLYASCGPFSYCDLTQNVPSCRCLDGFEPNGINFPRGCSRITALKCERQSHFVQFPEMKVPGNFLHIRNKSFDQCEAVCNHNCSCTAFAYANMSDGSAMADTSRCLVWSGELIDIGKIPNGENLYIRLADTAVDKKVSSVKIILPIIACLLLLSCTALIWICKYRGKRRNEETQKKMMLGYFSTSNELGGENTEFPSVNFKDILSATNFFANSNLLGRGGFGNVYKGTLEGGNEVAIKRLSKGSGQGTVEFKNEVVLISKLQHKNLVRLLGCCIHEDEKLLIYEYLPNKSLDAFLFDAAQKHVLDWFTRFKIIKGISRGLLYLHQDSRLTIIHRDLKASNILLDTEMTPKISDFGMARIFGANQNQANTTRVVGTYGYMSPEYAMGGAFSVKSDTYSFGVLLLEIVSGLKISSSHLIANFCGLIAYTWRLWEGGKAIQLVDSSVLASCPHLSNCGDGEGSGSMENSLNGVSITTLKGR
ncbi:G-type lectin S-receptor-like serine/threonine-protein kinase B120 [Lolium rigidum]|uniref:G-type lectin S-receptor-like serine/threonine-protein kinase B120 n=1 Tax=Lolium rigidum TaxID=89674 RepID=UPI001F5C12FA|nr:G-type lectin S-receptor-like serine/threonine-protein kinase B120 [Lolium rigidum]